MTNRSGRSVSGHAPLPLYFIYPRGVFGCKTAEKMKVADVVSS